ncbi:MULTISPECIES: sodium-extruding oxaloacetate decarboxylase subunit alpha [unclassified Vibrio]|uniref:Sodium-extruding oxaloacetate decarboxylase subunit alpha n=1 Tax=Vibrio sp. HB236076 TaxID=3232307 RepID=A0AB39HF26_9VIBR|nr:sodium-extruding oxaloacetate decarboxylase subunit alpha [Vibrio sp. HB161653]MDP5253983.1 sodium-extruding oxaloacetate decarboxylase subunit alpha [Vibrio sp. HB161653]
MSHSLALTDVVLRDAHQSLFATRLRIEDMLPVAKQLDDMGYWSLETWGGATFDACIRYLGEDPWERLRTLKAAMPKTPMQMLLRGQNLLGYRHYADDVVAKFVERAHVNGMDVFRIFDAMNDVRNFQSAVKAVVESGAHAQGTLSYTLSPVHNLDTWLDLAKRLEDLGCHSLCIKDMSGLLKPYDAYELIKQLKATCDIPIALHCHATTGLSTATAVKAIEAGVDILDTAISSMSGTYGHTPTETIVAMLEGQERDTGLELANFEPIAKHFRTVRKKYAEWEGQLKGIDARILTAQVPGGMLTNMESQLKQQGALDRMDEVLAEIPRVRKELGFIPLVTPTSQIVGTQSVINVLTQERYKTITKETAGVLKGEYGATPAPVDADLQARVLEGNTPMTDRPADHIADEWSSLSSEVSALSKEHGFALGKNVEDDVLTYALFPQVGLAFLQHRDDESYFEPKPNGAAEAAPSAETEGRQAAVSSAELPKSYHVKVNGQAYQVEISESGDVSSMASIPSTQPTPALTPVATNSGEPIAAPLAGTIYQVMVKPGDQVAAGDVLLVLEAMKMETEIRAQRAGVIAGLDVKEGDSVNVGQQLLLLS